MEKQELLYLLISDCTREELADEILKRSADHKKGYFVTPNLDFFRLSFKDTEFRSMLNRADFSTVDGTPVIWLSKIFRYKPRVKITGSDFSCYFIERMAAEKKRLFILGGKEGVAQHAKEVLEQKFSGELTVCGVCSPEKGFEDDPLRVQQVIETIKEAEPDVVLVCLGAPKQERFVYRNYADLPDATYFCVGATVDFLAGNIKRAPKFFRKCGMEWFYRLLKEPKRLFKRYFLDFFFLIKIFFVRLFHNKKIKKMLEESIGKQPEMQK